jgi:putative transposase
MREYHRSAHTVYALHYHFIFIPKYRKPVLRGEVGTEVRDLIREICRTLDIEIHIRLATGWFHLPHHHGSRPICGAYVEGNGLAVRPRKQFNSGESPLAAASQPQAENPPVVAGLENDPIGLAVLKKDAHLQDA